MSFVTFIYRISRKTYFGKYIFDDYVSDDHNGLDIEIRENVLHAINRYRAKHGKPALSLADLSIGILAFCPGNDYIPVYSSEDEYKSFDFYYSERISYINGKAL